MTFMLQNEKSVFKDFAWYEQWAATAKNDPVLRWLNDARVTFVHQDALAPHSWLKMRCLKNPDDPFGEDDGPVLIEASPFVCTHIYMQMGPHGNHAHEYTRHWSMDGLSGREILEVCADVYDRLDALVHTAHEHAGTSMLVHRNDGSIRSLPCMENVEEFRVVRTELRDGKEIWINEPPGLHSH